MTRLRIALVIGLLAPRLALATLSLDTTANPSGVLVKATEQNSVSSGATIVAASFSTGGTNRLIVAMVVADSSAAPFPTTMSGGGLTWTLRANAIDATNESGVAFYSAPAASTLSSVTVTDTFANAANGSNFRVAGLYIAAFLDSNGNMPGIGNAGTGRNAVTSTANDTINVSTVGSLLFGVFLQANGDNTTLTADANTTADVNFAATSFGDTWLICHYKNNPTTATGNQTFGSSATANGLYGITLEITPGGGTSVSFALPGVAGTGSAGSVTVTGDTTVALAGVAGIGSAGALTAGGDTTFALSGANGSGSAGTVTITGDANVTAPGVSGAGTAGALSASGDILVDLSTTHQTIEGFGASDAIDPTDWRTLTDAEVQRFFDPDAGIGLSMLRVGISELGTYAGRDDQAGTGTVFPSLWGDYTLAQRAGAYGVKIIGTPWTPPAASKSNNELWPGGSLNVGAYGSWSDTLAAWPAYMHGLTGVWPYAISVQNEPDFTPSSYQGCTYSTSQMASFIDTLGPKIAALSPRPLLISPEPSDWSNLGGYVSAIEGDSTATTYVDRFATHQYGHASAVSPTSSSRGYWETEMAGLAGGPEATWDPTITDGVAVAQWIHNAITTGNVSVWLWWWLVNPYNNDNEGLIGYSGDNLVGNPGNSPTITKRLYTLGNFSKFIRPGAVRVDVGGGVPSGVQMTAYKDASGSPIIVAINSNGSPTALNVGISGGTIPTVMTPWVTSSTDNLAPKTRVTVTGGSFSYSLPASSVTTFIVPVDETVALAGTAGPGAAGALTVTGDANVAASGASGGGIAGTLSVAGDASTTIAAAAATGSVGDLAELGDANLALGGASGAGSAADLGETGDASVALTVAAGSGSAGDVNVATGGDISFPLDPAIALGSAGSVSIAGDVNFTLAGVSGVGAAGNVTTGGDVTFALDTAIGAGAAGAVTVSGDALVVAAVAAGTGDAGVITVTVDTSVALDLAFGIGSAGDVTAIGSNGGDISFDLPAASSDGVVGALVILGDALTVLSGTGSAGSAGLIVAQGASPVPPPTHIIVPPQPTNIHVHHHLGGD